MKYLALIQARSGSTRFPGKVLKDLAGKPMLLREVERVRASKAIDEVAVVTTVAKADLEIVGLCAENSIRVFAGSEDDVLDRYYQMAKLLDPEYVVRITADCPCFDPCLLDEAIASMDPEADYLGMLSETFPDGLDLEIVKFDALRKAWSEANLRSQREHVTQYIVRNPGLFRLQDFVSMLGNHGDERWTVDEPEDFELVSKIYEHFSEGGEVRPFAYADILAFLDENPSLRGINDRFARNEGLQKSLREDGPAQPCDER